MFKVLKMYRDTEDPEMDSVDGKAFETLSNAECLELMGKYGINGLIIDPAPEFLCKLAFFTGQECPETGSWASSGWGETSKKRAKTEETVS